MLIALFITIVARFGEAVELTTAFSVALFSIVAALVLYFLWRREANQRILLAQLRENDELFRLMIDGIKDYAVFRLDAQGHVASWNTGAARIKGYSADEILGKHFSCFYTPQDQKLSIPQKVLRDAMTRGRAHAEGLRVRKDGSTFWAQVVVTPMYDSHGKFRGFSKVLHDVTERKRAEDSINESLLASRRMLKELTDQKFAMDQHAIISISDTQGNITYVNDHLCTISKYSREELQGKNHRVLNSGYHSKEYFQQMWQTIANGKVWHGEMRNRAKDGSTYWVDATIVPFLDEQGKPRQYTAIRSDITVQKRIEEQLREQAKVVDLAPVLVHDIKGRIVRWSRGAEKLYGFAEDEAKGRVSHELLKSVLPEPIEEIRQKLYQYGSWEGEIVHRRQDESMITVSSTWFLHRDSQGQPLHILEVNTDITERKRTEEVLSQQAEELTRQSEELARTDEALRMQSQLLQSVLDGMGEGLVVTDQKGKFLIWNPAAEKILGARPQNVPVSSWSEIYGLRTPDGAATHPTEDLPLVRALRGEACEMELQVRTPSSPDAVWIEVTARPLRDENGVIIAGVAAFRDITDRRISEQRIRALNDELERRVVQRTAELEASNKELEAFTYSVSHDLRAPLRHIAGFSGILMEDFSPSLPQEARQYLTRIHDGTRRMGQLIDELLNLGRVGRQPLNTQIVGLASLVESVMEELKTECEGRQVDWKIGELPFVECDAGLVRQVLQNLISNALKYSRPRPKAVIEVGQLQKEEVTAIFVRDNGVGFSMKYADKLFGVFQRLHRSEDFEGTGVGLAIVHRIIQKHKGRAWAEAELDQGATFYFTLEGLHSPSCQKQEMAVGA